MTTNITTANSISVHPNYINYLTKEYPQMTFTRVTNSDKGLYVTNESNEDMGNDLSIFRETLGKKLLRVTENDNLNLRKGLSYSYKSKNENQIYKNDTPRSLENGEKYAIHNIGHASQLIELPDCNILTDPVFGNLDPVMYREKTSSIPVKDLPRVDVILISHNHRDHVDIASLKELLKHYKIKDGQSQRCCYLWETNHYLKVNLGVQIYLIYLKVILQM